MLRHSIAALCALAPTLASAGPALGELDPSFGNANGASVVAFDQGVLNNDFGNTLVEAGLFPGTFSLVVAGTVDQPNGPDCIGLAQLSPSGVPEAISCFQPWGASVELSPYLTAINTEFAPPGNLSESGYVLTVGLGTWEGKSYPVACLFDHLAPVFNFNDGYSSFPVGGCSFFELLPLEDLGNRPSVIALRNPDAQKGMPTLLAAAKQIDGRLSPILFGIANNGLHADLNHNNDPLFLQLLPDEKFDAVATAGVARRGNCCGNLSALIAGFIDAAEGSDFFVAKSDFSVLQDFIDKDHLRIDFGPGSADIPTAIAINTSGDAFVVGTAELGNARNIAIVKFSAETGDLDPVFNNGQPATINPCNADLQHCTFDPTAIQIDADGLPVIAGQLAIDGVERMFALRLRNNGTIDTGFAPNAAIPGVASIQIGESAQAYGLVLQDDGRVVLGGNTVNGDHGQDFLAARLFVRGQKVFRDDFGP